MSYIVVISDKYLMKNEPTLLDDFTSTSQILISEFGFKIQKDQQGNFDFFYNDEFSENILGYDDGELWTKNPTDDFLQLLIDISARFKDSKVIGDSGEWYVSLEDIRYPENQSNFQKIMFLSNLKRWSIISIFFIIYFCLRLLVKN